MNFIIGLIVALVVVFHVLKGRIAFKTSEEGFRKEYTAISRAEKPLLYWLIVVVEAMIAILFLAGILKF